MLAKHPSEGCHLAFQDSGHRKRLPSVLVEPDRLRKANLALQLNALPRDGRNILSNFKDESPGKRGSLGKGACHTRGFTKELT